MIVWVVTAAVVVFMALIALWKARPGMEKFVRITNALELLPTFMDRTDKDVTEIRKAVFPNSGSSIPDGIARLERDMRTVLSRIDSVESWVQTESDEADSEHADLVNRIKALEAHERDAS